MSLTDNLAALTTAADAATQAVLDQNAQNAMDLAASNTALQAAVDRFDGFAVDQAITLYVGPTREFATINAAYDSIKNQYLAADVVIQVDDGIHNFTRLDIDRLSAPNRLIIRGNIANPWACKLNLVPDADGFAHGFIIKSATVNISGFSIEGNDATLSQNLRGIFASEGAVIQSDSGSMIFKNLHAAVQLTAAAVMTSNTQVCDNCNNGVIADFAHGNMRNWTITGTGFGVGFTAQHNAYLVVIDSTINSCARGIFSYRCGVVVAQGVQTTNCDIGFSTNTGIIHASWDGVSDASRARATGSTTAGFHALDNGHVFAQNARADQCGIGFYADRMSTIYANDSGATNCAAGYQAASLSHIEALSTVANTNTNTTNFTEANGVLSAKGSLINFN